MDFLRFNTEDFPKKITLSWQSTKSTYDGILQLPGGREIRLSQISSCWYRRPETPIMSGELVTQQTKEFAENECSALLKALWRYLGFCFWINYPFKIRQAESKIFNLQLAAEIGFSVPRTLVTNSPQESRGFFDDCGGNVINKTLGVGQIEFSGSQYFVFTHKVLPQDLDRIKDLVYAPSLFQEYIPKKLEIRVTVVGSHVFSCEIHSQASEKTRDDWRHYDFENVKHAVHQLPKSISVYCLKMIEKLDLNFATFDLILTPDNRYVFLELNPNGQWLWIEELTGLPISPAIANLLVSGGRGKVDQNDKLE